MPAEINQPKPDWIKRFRRAIKAWYSKNGRDLPWCGETDPYRVWIREIMLQQTTVGAVIPYLDRFFAEFPDVESLAGSSEQDVLRLWEGLGYYSRARNIHKAAAIVLSDFDGHFPQTLNDIQSLPGVGRYTAGAIASFALGSRAPIVEANTVRLYSRVIGLEDETSRASSQRALWEFAESIVPSLNPGQFNQALIDLGATVCRPQEPSCPSCPVRSMCRAFELNRVNSIPAAKKRAEPTQLYEAAIAISRRTDVLLRQRGDSEWWSGLWDFPRFGVSSASAAIDPEAGLFDTPTQDKITLEESTSEQTGIRIDLGSPIQIINHGVTRYRIRLTCYSATVSSGRKKTGSDLRWVKWSEIDHLPLTRTARQFADTMLARRNGNA